MLRYWINKQQAVTHTHKLTTSFRHDYLHNHREVNCVIRPISDGIGPVNPLLSTNWQNDNRTEYFEILNQQTASNTHTRRHRRFDMTTYSNTEKSIVSSFQSRLEWGRSARLNLQINTITIEQNILRSWIPKQQETPTSRHRHSNCTTYTNSDLSIASSFQSRLEWDQSADYYLHIETITIEQKMLRSWINKQLQRKRKKPILDIQLCICVPSHTLSTGPVPPHVMPHQVHTASADSQLSLSSHQSPSVEKYSITNTSRSNISSDPTWIEELPESSYANQANARSCLSDDGNVPLK